MAIIRNFKPTVPDPRSRPPRAAAWILLAVLALCAACTEPTASPTPIPSPTPSPTPEPKVLTVCLPEEPDSLYPYGTDSPAARHIWQAIYDGPFDSRSYGHQPVILTELPDLGRHSATVRTVSVQAGDRVLAANGEVVELAPGVEVKDTDGQRAAFDGQPIPMPQMVVTFTLQPDLYWSDGTLLTADDSVYAFELAAASAALGNAEPLPTAAAEHDLQYTAGYRVADPRTVVWTGVPGFLDHAYFLNFWHPLPRHAWGHLSAAQLLEADVSTRQPLGWGPFVLREWIPGDRITAIRNPIYFRDPEGLPRIDEVIFRFIPDPAALADELLAGRCDIVAHNAATVVEAALPDQSPIETFSSHDARWELLAFGISPAYDRPDFFENVQVRQAIALCIDRQAIVDRVTEPPGRVLHGPLPPEHPLYAGAAAENGSASVSTWGYAPAAGQTLLATAGWYDEDGDDLREAHGIPGIADGTPFQVTYHTTGDPQRVLTAQLIGAHLAKCGIQVNVETAPPEALFAPGPEGVLFGRQFALAQFSWRFTADPLCDLFLSTHMPRPGHWIGPNVVGFLDNEYDTACISALEAIPGSAGYAAGHTEAQRIFSERLPVLPLFQHRKVVLAQPSVIGLAPDPTQPSELWNIEQLDLRP